MKHRTSLQSRLLAYLRANPQAELSRQQIMDLFCAGVKHVDDTLTTMRREGLVETVHVTRLPTGAKE
jgi:DNA-binding IscR family transcriptional regulator